MEILTLKRPDLSFSDEIRSYRQEFLDAESPLNGCGPLADMEDPAEWIAHTKRFEKARIFRRTWCLRHSLSMSENPIRKFLEPSRSAILSLRFLKPTRTHRLLHPPKRTAKRLCQTDASRLPAVL